MERFCQDEYCPEHGIAAGFFFSRNVVWGGELLLWGEKKWKTSKKQTNFVIVLGGKSNSPPQRPWKKHCIAALNTYLFAVDRWKQESTMGEKGWANIIRLLQLTRVIAVAGSYRSSDDANIPTPVSKFGCLQFVYRTLHDTVTVLVYSDTHCWSMEVASILGGSEHSQRWQILVPGCRG